jgi:LacI family transcriptional regulator
MRGVLSTVKLTIIHGGLTITQLSLQIGPRKAFRGAIVIFSGNVITLSDIAKDLKVSVVTVSKVLRNQGRISARTRNRVLKRAKELDYRPNLVARSLVTRRTYTIGLLLPDFTHPFFAEIAKTIAETVRPRGYHVIISYFEEDPALERVEADSLLSRRVDGLILASSQSPERLDLFEQLQSRKLPFVLIDRPIDGVRASFVGVDNHAIGRLATAHLIERGCRRIAHLRGPKIGLASKRLDGYRDSLKKHRLKAAANYVVEAGFHDYTGYEAMKQLLKEKPAPDGVFCYNDPVAIGAMRAILEAGLKVPEDVAVVGAGNVHYSDALAVPLTTIDQKAREIGARAAELLLEQMAAKQPMKPREILLVPELVARKSTQRFCNEGMPPRGARKSKRN